MTSREWLFVGVLFALCVVTRLWDLGAKPIMHDEALFLYYTEYHLVRSFDYRYLPILHGPLHMWIQGFLFWLFGSSDATMRLGSALLGIAGFGWIVSLRPWLGRVGTPMALAFYTLSPGLMYYGRFFREDGVFIFIELWILASLAWWWRSRSHLWLASLLFACVALFCNKESSVFVYFILASFFVLAVCQDLADHPRSSESSRGNSSTSLPSIPLVAASIVIVCTLFLTQVMEGIRFDLNVTSELGYDFVLRDVRSIALALGWQDPVEGLGRVGSPFFWRCFYVLLIGTSILLAWGLRLAVERRWGREGLLADLWTRLSSGRYAVVASLSAGLILFLILFTTFFKYPENPFSIYHRTLSYWMGQHALHRIYGPFHQHMLNLAVYELPGLVILLIASMRVMTGRGWTRSSATAILLCALPLVVLHGALSSGVASPLMWFLAVAVVCVAAGAWALATPQLGGRIALTLTLAIALLGIHWFTSGAWGRFLVEAPQSHQGARLFHTGRQLLDDRLSLTSGFHLVIIALLIVMATVVTWRSLQRGDRMQALLVWYFVVMLGAASYAREKVPQVGIHAAIPLVLLCGLAIDRAWAWTSRRQAMGWRVVLVTLVALALVWQTRASFHLCFVHPGDVRERYVYGDTTNDVKHHVALIERYRNVASLRHERRPGSQRPEWIEGYNDASTLKQVRVHIADFDIVWQLRWYLRDIEFRINNDITPAIASGADFIFLPLGSENTPGLAENYHLYRGRLRMHWVPEPLNTGRLLDGWKVTIPSHNLSGTRQQAESDLAAREWARVRDYLLWRRVSYDRDPGLSYVEYFFAVRRDLPPF